MVGTYAGCALVDEILQIIDPQLHAICPESRSWAFKYISSFLTNQKPLREVLKLWVRLRSLINKNRIFSWHLDSILMLFVQLPKQLY
jgi:hypothetical protein